MEPKWQSIETAPTDFTVFMVAWPHSQMDGGWFFDFWAGKRLLDVRKAYDEGLDKLSPHMWQMPTHWRSLPAAPDATNTHPPATDVAALVEAAKKIVKLWALLDDIDTLDDACRGDDSLFRKLARDVQQSRFAIVSGEEWDAARISTCTEVTPVAALAPFTKGQNDE